MAQLPAKEYYHQLLKQHTPPLQYPFKLRIWLEASGGSCLQQRSSGSSKTPLECLAKAFKEDTSNSTGKLDQQAQRDLKALFEKFQELSTDHMEDANYLYDEGYEQFLSQALGIPDTRFNQLVVAFILGCDRPGEISQQEFINGFMIYNVSAQSKIHAFMQTHYSSFKERYLKEIYTVAFRYGNKNKVRSTLPLKNAIAYWQVFLPFFGTFNTFPDWTKWLSEVYFKGVEGPEVTLDLWKNFFDFAKQMQDDYIHNYNFAGDDGWNTVLDKFVLDFLDLEVVTVDPF